ncbi:MAG: hypothetical protein KC964_12570, partial [Candidatus Omnitrophica bacterium]|nr:hypothetical protein [Candidatus Omnitrophota bacterium]
MVIAPNLVRWMDGERGPRSLTFSPDGKYFYVTKGDQSVSKELVSMITWMDFRLSGQRGYVKSLAFRPDNRILATGSSAIGLWDTETGENIAITDPPGEMTDLGFARSGSPLAAVTNRGVVMLWYDPPRGECVRIGDHGNDIAVTSLDHSPIERMMVTVGLDGKIKFWNVDHGTLTKEIDSEEDSLNTVVYSNDGRTIFTGGIEGKIKEWNVQTGIKLRTLGGHKDSVMNLAMFPDGTRLASGGKDLRVKVWDLDSGNELASIKVVYDDPFPLVISPDNRRILSFEQIWDAETYDRIGNTHSGLKAISPDGQLLAVGGSPSFLRIVPSFPFFKSDFEDSDHSIQYLIEKHKAKFWSKRSERL